jgi:hypothetical protein
MIVTHKLRVDIVKIYVEGILHLFFSKHQLIGIQSWVEGKDFFVIEITLSDGIILCEYDTKEKWLSILAILDEIIP